MCPSRNLQCCDCNSECKFNQSPWILLKLVSPINHNFYAILARFPWASSVKTVPSTNVMHVCHQNHFGVYGIKILTCCSHVFHLPTKIIAKDRAKRFPGVFHKAGVNFCTMCNIVVEHKQNSSIDKRFSTVKHSRRSTEMNRPQMNHSDGSCSICNCSSKLAFALAIS